MDRHTRHSDGHADTNAFSFATFLPIEQIGAVESVKAASDVFSPVTGQVAEINADLGDQPGLLNKSPEEKGE